MLFSLKTQSMETGLGFITFDERDHHIYSLSKVTPEKDEAIGLLEALS